MAVWILILVVNLIFPITMICFGGYFIKKAPQKINYFFGYRTSMSMKNNETWVFAHRFFGKIWFLSGLIALPVAVVVMLAVLGRETKVIELTGEILCGAQMLLLIGSILPTELALRKRFDKDGKRR